MGGKDSKYQIVYREESLQFFKEGEWVFFQRSKESGGGFWFGRTLPDCFWLELERPTSLREGLLYLLALEGLKGRENDFDDDFTLE